MKKKLEAELISIAHRILKLKNKSELVQLHLETQRLYEKLSVLRFVEENFGDVKPTIGLTEIEEQLDSIVNRQNSPAQFDAPQVEPVTNVEEDQAEREIIPTVEMPSEENQSSDVKEQNQPVATVLGNTDLETTIAQDHEETVTEDIIQSETEPENLQIKATDPSFFKPAFELSFDAKAEEPQPKIQEDAKEDFKTADTQITFEDILGSSYIDPVFVKPEDLKKEYEATQTDNVIPIGRNFSDNAPVISINKADQDFRSVSLNERLSKGITIGLNDRVAFMKHLFANSSEDYNRVLSQLITFDTFAEAQSFIDNMVKPDYNNWEGKDEYAERFMEIVEKKFS